MIRLLGSNHSRFKGKCVSLQCVLGLSLPQKGNEFGCAPSKCLNAVLACAYEDLVHNKGPLSRALRTKRSCGYFPSAKSKTPTTLKCQSIALQLLLLQKQVSIKKIHIELSAVIFSSLKFCCCPKLLKKNLSKKEDQPVFIDMKEI